MNLTKITPPTGCSCGCLSRWLRPGHLGYYLDPDCVLATPVEEFIDYDDSPVFYAGRLTSVGQMWNDRRAA